MTCEIWPCRTASNSKYMDSANGKGEGKENCKLIASYIQNSWLYNYVVAAKKKNELETQWSPFSECLVAGGNKWKNFTCRYNLLATVNQTAGRLILILVCSTPAVNSGVGLEWGGGGGSKYWTLTVACLKESIFCLFLSIAECRSMSSTSRSSCCWRYVRVFNCFCTV